ncbi:MAG TPA: DUF423 domain-containing protein [Chitinophagaceae bacterium]|nr:DUF423 domain-containing protein [Chitinophagaceae bacterium]
MHKKFITTGALLGAIAVALGAFGAHGLKKIVSAETVQTFQTGVQYQIYHALALLLTGLLYEKCYQKFARMSGVLFIIGIILFSGSLYLIAAGKAAETTSLDKAGIITPFGGIAFIAGWLFLFLAAMKKDEKS